MRATPLLCRLLLLGGFLAVVLIAPALLAGLVLAGPGPAQEARPWLLAGMPGAPGASRADTAHAAARSRRARPSPEPAPPDAALAALAEALAAPHEPPRFRPDPAPGDTLDTLRRARLYFASPLRDGFSAALATRRYPRLRGGVLSGAWRREVALDTTDLVYAIRETVGGADVREPVSLGLAAYLAAQREAALADGFRTLAEQRALRRQTRRGGVGITVDIPGGSQSAFRTLFGKNEVDLRVTGSSDLDFGAGYSTNELQRATSAVSGVLAPAFQQQLNLNVAGTIGDKLRVNVNYDTRSEFNFENQVSLVYTGYEDDIVKKIEAGNVFLQTPSELIRGGQRLFGLRTDLQFGPLAVTAVASQQDAESREVTIDGGSQATTFSLPPSQYENNTHFFLGFAFHNWWDEGHRDPSNLTSPPGFSRLTGIEVWRQDAQANAPQQNASAEIIRGIALVDLGEPAAVRQGARAYLAEVGPAAPLPAPSRHAYTEQDLADLRERSEAIDIAARFGLRDQDFERTRFRRLTEGTDYTVDPFLGWLSLRAPLSDNDVLAVAYQYRTLDGQTVTVGDFGAASQGNSQTGPHTILKLLRDKLPAPTDASWGLTMRNIYRVGGRQLNPTNFEFDIFYEPPGSTPQTQLPGVTFGEGLKLLQALGLDRTNREGQPLPDQRFDFRAGYTIDADNGRVIFPVREPFGAYLDRLFRTGRTVSGTTVDVTIQGAAYEQVADDFVFPQLYTLKPDQFSRQFPKERYYALRGQYRGASQSVYNVGFGLVPGSVRVTAGGRQLTEGADYVVNYSAGTVEIRNPIYLADGQQIRVQVEQNRFASVGSKSLLGLRADYRLGERAGLGATWMQLSERPLVDKFRIGEEAIQNSIFGVDGSYAAEPRWLTRAVDALPLVQTRAPSRFQIRGEFARLSPGSPETFAFREVRRTLRALDGDRDLADDERRGISYIDDFEGAEFVNSSLFETAGWRISSAPTGAGPPGTIAPATATTVTDVRLANNWRGLFAWYALDLATYNGQNRLIREAPLTPATRPVSVLELFPDRQVTAQEAQTPLRLLDLYFDPSRRGPYNYNGELETTFASDPRRAWGGMTRAIDPAYSDFDGRNSVEFVEFIVAPLGGRDGTEPVAPGAMLYLDLGDVSEDVLPNNILNSEDGLVDGSARAPESLDLWGRRPSGFENTAVDLFEATGRTEDLGLNGLPSDRNNTAGQPYDYDEREHFAAFLATLTPGTPEYNRARLDPSADDYRHFRESVFNDEALYPGGASIQERFAHYLPGLELNSIRAYAEIRRAMGTLESDRNASGISNFPNTEDINGNFTLDTVERFYRYAIPLDAAGIRASPFFQNEIVTQGETWYLMRIPVRTSEREAVGGIDDLSRVQMARLWTTGHDRPATLRFASFKLVGSQWQKSERVGLDDAGGEALSAAPALLADGTLGVGALRRTRAPAAAGTEPRLFIESINNEESPQRYVTPRGALVSTTRDISGQALRTREASLVFRVENLGPGQTRALYKPYTTSRLDLTRYTNLRMFVHGEGFERRDSMRVVVRLGANETEDYYEYEQPVYPFESSRLGLVPEAARADSLWQTRVNVGGEWLDLNSVNIVLSELNQLKVARDDAGVPREVPFGLDRTPQGAPSGARIRVRGNPSIQAVSTIVLGVRYGAEAGAAPLENVQVWFNELRMSGYDEGGGASGFVATDLALADLMTVSARASFTQDGFGELGGGLGGRALASQRGFTLTSTFNAHKLLPERHGWRIPVSVSVVENESTPRFAPNRGDIRLDDLVARAQGNDDLPAPERQIEAERIVREAQTATSSRTLRVPISKTGSRSPWLRYTLDGLSATYASTSQRSRTPSSEFAHQDSWRTDLAYRLAVPRPRTVRPLWFVDDLPLLGALAGTRLNVLPQQIRVTADLGRTMGALRERPRLGTEGESEQALSFLYPTRRTHAFGHGRTLDVQYNPFWFMQMGYSSNVAQSLNQAGVDETFRIFVRRADGSLAREYALSREEAQQEGSPVWQDFGIETAEQYRQLQVFGGSQISIVPVGTLLSDVLAGERRVTTDRYTQTLTSSVRVTTQRIRYLAWLRPQPISLSSAYAWDVVPLTNRPDLTVASVGANTQIQTGLQARPRDFWRLFPFYRRLEEADRLSRQPARPAAAGEGAATGEGAASGERGLSPRLIARRAFLALTGVEDLTITYRGSQRNSSGGVEGRAFSLPAGLFGDAPGVGYRLGLERRLPLERRLGEDVGGLRFQDLLGDQHDLSARTSLQPFPSLRIGLTWTTGWSRNDLFPFAFDDALGQIVEQPAVRRGGGESTVLGFGGSYERLLERQRARLSRDLAGAPGEGGVVASEYRSRMGLSEDFQRTFARGLGRFGPEGLFALPMPSWDVNYTGLNSLPLVRRFAQQATLRHSYFASSRADYASVDNFAAPLFQVPAGAGTVLVQGETPDVLPSTISVNARFQPLLGLSVGWRGGVQTDLTWNRSFLNTLQPGSATINEKTVQDVQLQVSYSRTGLRLFGRRQLNNALRFTLTGSIADDESYVRPLGSDLDRLVAGLPRQETQAIGFQRVSLWPRIGYQLSNQVGMDVFVRYDRTRGQGGQIPGSSKLDGGVSLRISFSN
ncbi:MAG: cell surface protein SprA [Rubricoccaceae bacterium]